MDAVVLSFWQTLRHSILESDNTFCAGAMGTTKKFAICFHSMANDIYSTVLADRRHSMDSALKTIEGTGHTIHNHLKGFIVIIST